MARSVPRLLTTLLGAALLLGAGFTLAYWWISRAKVIDEEVRRVVMTTIQREAPASFYVTGTLEATTTVTVENTKYLLPDLLRLSLGTTRATVRVPGRVSYGFDVRTLRPQDIRLGEDGVIEVTLPDLRVYSVEPVLESMEVQTTAGWTRLLGESRQRVQQEALAHVREALRTQAAAHLARSSQPRLHTAEGLEKLLTPVLQAAGVTDPVFRFQVGPRLMLEGR